MPIDDLILTWLSPEARPAGPVPGTDDKECPSCGYVGEFVADAGRSYCPACFGILPSPPAKELRRIVTCPNCDVEITLSDSDRNKTIVCPRCKFFLGCLYRDEP